MWYNKWKAFSSNPDEQEGWYFPVYLTKPGKTMTFKKNGKDRPDKTNLPFDNTIVFRVDDKNTTHTIIVDGKELVTLSFRNVNFLDWEESYKGYGQYFDDENPKDDLEESPG